jgi:uncharacterized membrane protein
MKFQNSREYQYLISKSYYALAILPMLIFTWVYLEMKHKDLMPLLHGALANTAVILLGLLLLITFVFPFYYFRRQIDNHKSQNSLRKKLESVSKLYFKFYLALSFAMYVATAGYYLTQVWFFGLGFMLLILLYSFYRPTPEKFCKDLRLPKEQRDAILNFHTISE